MHNHRPPWISMEFHELTNTVKDRKQWLVDEWSVHWFSWKSFGQTKNYKKVPQSRKTNKPRIRGTRVQSTNLETPSFLLGTRAGERTATNPHKQFSYRCLHGTIITTPLGANAHINQLQRTSQGSVVGVLIFYAFFENLQPLPVPSIRGSTN